MIGHVRANKTGCASDKNIGFHVVGDVQRCLPNLRPLEGKICDPLPLDLPAQLWNSIELPSPDLQDALGQCRFSCW